MSIITGTNDQEIVFQCFTKIVNTISQSGTYNTITVSSKVKGSSIITMILIKDNYLTILLLLMMMTKRSFGSTKKGGDDKVISKL